MEPVAQLKSEKKDGSVAQLKKREAIIITRSENHSCLPGNFNNGDEKTELD